MTGSSRIAVSQERDTNGTVSGEAVPFVSVAAGTRNHRYLQLTRARLPKTLLMLRSGTRNYLSAAAAARTC